MTREGVVHALRQARSAVGVGGLVVDTQPISARPTIESANAVVGRFDMSEFQDTDVARAYAAMDDAIAAGDFTLQEQWEFDVLDEYDDGAELVETVSDWQGTRITDGLAAHVRDLAQPLFVRQT